jgi:AraC-like DNA-binding protein
LAAPAVRGGLTTHTVVYPPLAVFRPRRRYRLPTQRKFAGATTAYDSQTVAYRERMTANRHVACLWTRDQEPRAAQRRILPDACVDIVWTGSRLVVAGPATRPKIAHTPARTTAFGVRFRVGAAGAALRIPASELLDLTVPLEDVWADAAEIEETASARGVAGLAEAILTRIREEPDAAVRAAATGSSPVGLGERQLRRRFGDAVGYGPKTLERVLRFQRFLTLAEQPAPLAQLAFAAGYADQAHLTRECSRLSGLPPAALLASGARPAGERFVAPASLAA